MAINKSSNFRLIRIEKKWKKLIGYKSPYWEQTLSWQLRNRK